MLFTPSNAILSWIDVFVFAFGLTGRAGARVDCRFSMSRAGVAGPPRIRGGGCIAAAVGWILAQPWVRSILGYRSEKNCGLYFLLDVKNSRCQQQVLFNLSEYTAAGYG